MGEIDWRLTMHNFKVFESRGCKSWDFESSSYKDTYDWLCKQEIDYLCSCILVDSFPDGLVISYEVLPGKGSELEFREITRIEAVRS